MIFYADALAQPGLNLCNDGGGPSATLMSMDGTVLHEWHYELNELLTPDEIREIGETFNAVPDKFGYYRRVHPFPNGDLLAIFSDAAVIKLDRDSNLVWAWRGNPHHDLFVDSTPRASCAVRRTSAKTPSATPVRDRSASRRRS